MADAASASAARNKIASHLRNHGFKVEPSRYGCPPTDDDFLELLLSVAERARSERYSAVVIFEFWQLAYQIPLPASVLDDLTRGAQERYELFSTSHARDGAYRSTFYLASNESDEIVVFREKHWRRLSSEELDTTVLRLGTDR